MIKTATLAAAVLLTAGSAAAQTYPSRIPTPGGEVVLPSEGDRRAYDGYRYAAARRAGDVLYLSGVIVGRQGSEGKDIAAFKSQTRRAFERLKRTLEASGGSFANVTMINSFHVWQGPNLDATRDQQFQAFEEVMDEFMDPPWPAWTAVGTTGLLSDGGIVEVQMIAHLPG